MVNRNKSPMGDNKIIKLEESRDPSQYPNGLFFLTDSFTKTAIFNEQKVISLLIFRNIRKTILILTLKYTSQTLKLKREPNQ